MVISGGTILSGAHVSPSLNRGRMRVLLLSSALATVLSGVIQPGTANAACTTYNNNTTTTALDRGCDNGTVTVSPGVTVTGQGVGTSGLVNNGASVSNSGIIASTAPATPGNFPNAVDLSGEGTGALSYSGTGSVGSTNGNGIAITGAGTGSATVTVTGGTIIGGGGDAVHSDYAGNLTVSGTNAAFIGSDDGIDAAGTLFKVDQVGGVIQGTAGNGIASDADTTLIATNGTLIQGGTNGINVGGTYFSGSLINGSVVAKGGDGIVSTAGETIINTNGTVIQGTGNGIAGLGDKFDAALIGGTVTGASDDGIYSTAGIAGVTTDGTTVKGGSNGIELNGATSFVQVKDGSVTGTNGDGIRTVASGFAGVGGTTTVNTLDTAAILGGQNGINAVSLGLDTETSTKVTVDGATVTGTSGIGISAMSLSGSLGGGEKDATTTVSGRANITGGTTGILAIAGSTSNDPTTFNPNDPSTWAPGAGKAVVNVDVTGNVEGTAGSGIVALGIGNGGNDVDVRATGNVTANGGFAVLAGSVATGGAAGTVDILVSGDVINNGIGGGTYGGGVLGFNTNGDTTVTVTTKVELAPGGLLGVGAISGGTGNALVETGAGSSITADTGVFAGHFGGTGNATAKTGANSVILGGSNGVRVQSIDTTGDAVVETGTNSLIAAKGDGIVARKKGGSGDVSVTTGVNAHIYAGDDTITATNFSSGSGSDVNVTTGAFSVALANDKGIRAGGWDNVTITTGTNSLLVGDTDTDGVGNGIRIFSADVATVNVGTNSSVIGSGKSWSEAVISIDSDDATNINVSEGALVSSWSFTGGVNPAGLIKAASDIVIDTDGGATTISNYGTIVGRVGLTNNADVFNNFSSNTWVTVGNNYFGGGEDVVNNTGRVVTALQGDVAETTNFYGLETFNNGDSAFVEAGLLTMIDETPGQTAWNGKRDVTYVSGVFNGVGNSTVGVDAYLGAAGSTSDMLVVGGRDVNGNNIAGLVTTGQTAVLINDLSDGPGAYNPTGIKLVEVVDPDGVTYGKGNPNGPASFVISPDSANYSSKFGGVIDKGLFFYDFAVIGNDVSLIGMPDQEVFELPKLVTGAQAIWHETTGVWLDRQADLRTYLQGSSTTDAPSKVSPGIWGKVIGSWSSRDASDSISAYNRTYSFDTSYSQDIYGFMAGADFGREGVFTRDGTVLFGVLGGYVASDLSFDASPSSATYSGGTVGAYATYLTGNWYVDALFKADFLSMDYKAPTLFGAGYFGQSTNATNLGFVVDAGYRFFRWGSSGFVDALGTLSYVNTNISDLALVPGTLVDFGNNDSLRGSVGARVGSQIADGGTYRVEASLTGRLWYEFLGDNAITLFNPGVPFSTADNFDGLFGEVGAGVNIFGKDNGWNGFANAALKFGDSYTAGSAKGGVRYQW